MKRNKLTKRRSGTSPYRKYDKKPFTYSGDRRLANGDLQYKANDKKSNKYQ